MEPMNREQRRREKFGKAGKVHQHNPVGPWPDSEANPALKNVIEDQAVPAADAEKDVADVTDEATGAGGALTEAETASKPKAARPTKTAKG